MHTPLHDEIANLKVTRFVLHAYIL
jgi:hypothetical protein